ncbi:hypothetical protein SAMN05421636_106212 [Pricia antarctica]|uniref:Uncharacterized protein n=1 Tax=Pricia antarctica TaxID=641691 RepID=A0A1G7EIZ4_9FLAO|nr:hypothetical protein SAMN05421636_106212 [Pricia antarctica]
MDRRRMILTDGIEINPPAGEGQFSRMTTRLAIPLKLILLVITILFFKFVRCKDIFENEGHDD